MVPPFWPISLPLGIWALAVLRRPAVAALFGGTTEIEPSVPPSDQVE
jgi:hypothetical protein